MKFRCIKDGLFFQSRSWRTGETLEGDEPRCGRGTSLVDPPKGQPAFELIEDAEGPPPAMQTKPKVAPVPKHDTRTADQIREELAARGYPMPDRTGRKKLLEKEAELNAIKGKDHLEEKTRWQEA